MATARNFRAQRLQKAHTTKIGNAQHALITALLGTKEARSKGKQKSTTLQPQHAISIGPANTESITKMQQALRQLWMPRMAEH